jgi:hypothetical protein
MSIYWTGSQSAVTDPTLAEILSFSRLAPGWHYGEGGPIPQQTIAIALSLVRYIRDLGIWDIDAFAGCGGEISLLSTYKGYDIEAIVERDDSVSVAHDFNGNQVSYKARLGYKQATKEILAILGKAWSTSGYFIHEITTPNEIDLPVSPSVTYAGAYRWSNTIVYYQPARVFPLTFERTLTNSLPSQPSSGNSTDQYCLDLTG